MRFIIFLMLGALLSLGACAPVEKPGQSNSHYILGVSYLRTGDPTMALKELLKAEEIEPDNAEIQAALGQALLLKKALSESETHYKLALKLDEGNPHYQNNLAALYLKMERYDDAIKYFRMAASNLLFPRPEVSWTGLGYAELKKENYSEALIAFDKALALNWRFPAAYVRRGEVYYAQGEVDKAIAEYKLALDHAPTSTLAHYDLGVAYLKKRNTDQAISYFESVLNLEPQSELGRQSKSFLSVLK